MITENEDGTIEMTADENEAECFRQGIYGDRNDDNPSDMPFIYFGTWVSDMGL